MNVKHPLHILTFSLLLSLAACGGDIPMDRDLLVGRYVTSYSHGSENLWLNSDGTFSQVYIPNDKNPATTNSGKWEMNQDFKDVVLRGAILFDQRGHRAPDLKCTVWQLAVIKRFGEISLSRDVDKAFEFKKEGRQ